LEPPLLIAGWSARAAAQSARLAGRSVTAIDAYLDADLRAVAVEFRRVTDLRHIAAVAAEMTPREWMYVGGLENHAATVAAVSRRHRLLGTGAAALRRLRDPSALRVAVRRAELPFPEVRSVTEAATISDQSKWLVKCRRSSGGLGVAPLSDFAGGRRGTYLQERIDGQPCGATYVAAGGRSRLLGVCRQLCATADPAWPYLYGGSIGPLSLSMPLRSRLERLGDAIAAEFEVAGLFGIDFILAGDGVPWPVEVNPRYTASVEVIERAAGASLLACHVAACRDGVLPPAAMPTATQTHGKKIVYCSDEELRVSAECSQRWLEGCIRNDDAPPADIPVAGTRIRRGEPIATVLVAGASGGEVERRLNAAERRLLDDLRSAY
jgi:predicted ATP-grasp superfamily ATP-dependent carboligase